MTSVSQFVKQRGVIKCCASWERGVLKQIETRAPGHLQKYLVVSTDLQQNPSILTVEENVFHCGILAEDNVPGNQCLTGTNPNKTQVCQAKPFQLGNRYVQAALGMASHPDTYVWLRDIPVTCKVAPDRVCSTAPYLGQKRKPRRATQPSRRVFPTFPEEEPHLIFHSVVLFGRAVWRAGLRWGEQAGGLEGQATIRECRTCSSALRSPHLLGLQALQVPEN